MTDVRKRAFPDKEIALFLKYHRFPSFPNWNFEKKGLYYKQEEGNSDMINNKKSPDAMLLGMGLDNEDGHKRMTKGDNFCLVGGSEETHERMTETAIKFNEKLARKGKHLKELSPEEFRDMMREASER